MERENKRQVHAQSDGGGEGEASLPDGPVMCPWPVGEIVARLAATAMSSRLRTSKPARILTGSGTGICPFLPLSKQRDRRSSARALSASGRSIPCAIGKRKGVCTPEGLDVACRYGARAFRCRAFGKTGSRGVHHKRCGVWGETTQGLVQMVGRGETTARKDRRKPGVTRRNAERKNKNNSKMLLTEQ